MTNQNLYATVTDYKAYKTQRAGASLPADTADDAIISDLLEQASRYLDDMIGTHSFFPEITTRNYDAQPDRYIRTGKDLLEILTFTNGNGDVIASTDYLYDNQNYTPYFGVKIRDTSSVSWQPNAYSSFEQVLSIYGVWGYHTNYARAWKSAGTLGATIVDTTGLTFTATAGHSLVAGQIIKIDTELFNIASVATNTVTVNFRGDNGSTAATHLINAPVYVWQAERLAKQCTLEYTHYLYELRFGRAADNIAVTTAAGVVIKPKGVPQSVIDYIDGFMI